MSLKLFSIASEFYHKAEARCVCLGRSLTDDEIEVLKKRREGIRDQMIAARKQRFTTRVNAHTTEQTNRVISASAGHSQSVITEVTRVVNEAKTEILRAGRPEGVVDRAQLVGVRA